MVMDLHDADAPEHCELPMVPIVYGYPSAALVEASSRGHIVLGGCVVEPDQPEWVCGRCGARR